MNNDILEQIKRVDQARLDLELALDEARQREDDLGLEIKKLKKLMKEETEKNG